MIYDDIIGKSSVLGYYFDYFLKDLIYYHVPRKFNSKDLTGSGFLIWGFLPLDY